MKHFVIAVVVLVALSIYFSFYFNIPAEAELQNAFGVKNKGDSGLIIPGDGEAVANVSIKPEHLPEQTVGDKREPTAEETAVIETTKETEHLPSGNKEPTQEPKEKNSMDSILISF